MAAQTIISLGAMAVFSPLLAVSIRDWRASKRAQWQRLEAACLPAVVRQSDAEWCAWVDGLLREAGRQGVRIVTESTSWRDYDALDEGQPVRSGVAYTALGGGSPVRPVVGGWRRWLSVLIFGLAVLGPSPDSSDYRAYQRQQWKVARRQYERERWAAWDTQPIARPTATPPVDIRLANARRIQAWANGQRTLQERRTAILRAAAWGGEWDS